MKPISLARQQGFTLMEVLIAVTITAVIGIGVWQMMSSVIISRDRVDDVAEDFEALQKTFLLIERDVTQIVNRPIRNIYGDYEPALSSRSDAFDLVLTHQGWRNPLGAKRSELQRSAYEFTGDELRRRYWVEVDQGQDEESRDLLLVSDVTDFEVRFMDQERGWVGNWPPEDVGTSGTSENTNRSPQLPMPLGIELTLTHSRFGELKRIFLLPDFDRSAAQSSVTQLNENQATPPEEPEQSEEQTNPETTQ